MSFFDDFDVDYNSKRIRHTSGNAIYTLQTMYSEFQDLFDDLNQMDDEVPMSANTPTDFNMINEWFIDPDSLEYIKTGTLQSLDWTSDIRLISYDGSAAAPDDGFSLADLGRVIEGSTTGDTGTILHFDERYGTELGVVWIRPDDPTGGGDEFDNVAETFNTPTGDTAFLMAMDAAIADDNGAFTDETTAANEATANDMTLLPAAPVANQDGYYFGDSAQFGRLELNIGTQGAGTWTITWQYWDGTTWAALSGVVDDTSGFTAAAGQHTVRWDVPTDWATTTVNSQGPFYYVRARLTAFSSITTQPLGTQGWFAARAEGVFTNTLNASSSITGEDVYTGVTTIGSLNEQRFGDPDTQLYILQNGVTKADHASATSDNTALGSFGQIDILLQTQEADVAIDNGDFAIYARKLGTLYSHSVTRQIGGNVPVALAPGADLNDALGSASFNGSSGQGNFTVGEVLVIVTEADDARSEDGGSFTDETADFTSAAANDVSPFPTMAADDNFYVGRLSRFAAIALNVGTAGDHDATLTLEYSQDGGTWASLSNVQVSSANFEQLETSGYGVITFDVPDDWEQATVDSQTFYYVRWNVSAFTSQTTPPLITQGWSSGTIPNNNPFRGYVTAVGADSNDDTEYHPLADNLFVATHHIFGVQSAADTTIDTVDNARNGNSTTADDLTVTFDRISRDLNNGAGAQNYEVEVDATTTVPIATVYRRIKYLTRLGNTADIDDGAQLAIDGEHYTGAEVRLDYSGGSGVAHTVGDIITGATSGATGILMGEDAVASGHVHLTQIRGAGGSPFFQTGETINDAASGGSWAATVDTVAPVQTPPASPLGTFAGGTLFFAPAVWFANPFAGDEQSFVLIDCTGTTQNPPNSVTVQITQMLAGDSAFIVQTDTNGDIIKLPTQTAAATQNNHSSFTVAAGNNKGDTDFVVADDGESSGSIQQDIPDGSDPDGASIRVIDNTFNDEQRYRYSSFTALTFTLFAVGDATGTSDAGTSSTVITDTGVTWATGADQVRVGDIIRNTADDVFAYVVSVDSDTQLTTTSIAPFDWGAVTYEINRLVRNYSTADFAYVPYLDRKALTTSEANTIIQSTSINVLIRVRNSTTGNEIVPFETTGQIDSGGLTQAAIRNEDTIAT